MLSFLFVLPSGASGVCQNPRLTPYMYALYVRLIRSNKQCFAFNIQVLVRFWVNHHLLDLVERPQWRVVKNRSRSYVEKVS